MRIALAVSLLLIFITQVVADDLCIRTPGEAARALYEKHQQFIFSGASSPPLSEAFAQAIQANLEEQRRTGDIGLIDWNYWTDAQDGEQSKSAKVATVTAKAGRAQVELSYQFFPLPSASPVPKQAIVELSRTRTGCWLIEDVRHGKKSVMTYLQPPR